MSWLWLGAEPNVKAAITAGIATFAAYILWFKGWSFLGFFATGFWGVIAFFVLWITYYVWDVFDYRFDGLGRGLSLIQGDLDTIFEYRMRRYDHQDMVREDARTSLPAYRKLQLNLTNPDKLQTKKKKKGKKK